MDKPKAQKIPVGYGKNFHVPAVLDPQDVMHSHFEDYSIMPDQDVRDLLMHVFCIKTAGDEVN